MRSIAEKLAKSSGWLGEAVRYLIDRAVRDQLEADIALIEQAQITDRGRAAYVKAQLAGMLRARGPVV